MILCDYRGVKIKSDNDDEKMQSFKDANNDEVEYLVESESLMVRCALNVQVKENELKQYWKPNNKVTSVEVM